ncbi:hypothetical protein EB796_019032 [Bugula neritina]|uniref:Uncharacterized protein n=1 Tax=Bugula neritina TaxID=10212 RepID=A0A7J7J8T7_BUGNE|nr:hypothetical protein EB796_019032 [Bugula neritina]
MSNNVTWFNTLSRADFVTRLSDLKVFIIKTMYKNVKIQHAKIFQFNPCLSSNISKRDLTVSTLSLTRKLCLL